MSVRKRSSRGLEGNSRPSSKMQEEQPREEERIETPTTMTGREVQEKEVVLSIVEGEAAENTVVRSSPGLLLAIREAVAMAIALDRGGARTTEALEAAGTSQVGAAEEGNPPATAVVEDIGGMVIAEAVGGREGILGPVTILLTVPALGLEASQALGMEEEATPSITLDREWEEVTGLEVEEEVGPQGDFQHRHGPFYPWVVGSL